MKKFVAIAGNIGVGKSTLVKLLSDRLQWEPFYEPEGENPYLADFYREMRAWSFQSQVFFLSRRLRAHRQLLDHPTSAIQDRSVYEDAEIFARNLFLQGHMAERDYQTYLELLSDIKHVGYQSSSLNPMQWVVRNGKLKLLTGFGLTKSHHMIFTLKGERVQTTDKTGVVYG